MANEAGSKSDDEALAGKKILVIEDEYLIAIEIESTLREAGALAVELVSNVEDALGRIASSAWDAVITDNNLQGRSCEEIVAALHANRIPFVVVTGYDPRWLHRSLGDAPVLVKPFASPTLVACVRGLCR